MNELYIDGQKVKCGEIKNFSRFFLNENDWQYCKMEINGQKLETYIKKSDLEKLKTL